MRRSALAVALLLATAPVAHATEVTPEVKPELRAVEVATPSIRQDVMVAPARAEARNSRAAAVQGRMSTTTIVILVLAVIGALVLVGAVL